MEHGMMREKACACPWDDQFVDAQSECGNIVNVSYCGRHAPGMVCTSKINVPCCSLPRMFRCLVIVYVFSAILSETAKLFVIARGDQKV